MEKVSKETEVRDRLALERTLLANERTLLAYVRTALAMVGGGGVLQLGGHDWTSKLGWLLILLGSVTLGFGFYRFSVVLTRVRREKSESKTLSDD